MSEANMTALPILESLDVESPSMAREVSKAERCIRQFVAEVEKLHEPRVHELGEYECNHCYEIWPCSTIKLVKEYLS